MQTLSGDSDEDGVPRILFVSGAGAWSCSETSAFYQMVDGREEFYVLYEFSLHYFTSLKAWSRPWGTDTGSFGRFRRK